MKTVYIPRGESRTYETLVTETLVVHGHLHVVGSVKAKRILGKGVIEAGEISADVISMDVLECATLVCRRLLAKHVSSAEVFASDCAAVSRFLAASYVKAGRLTVANSEIDVVDADTVINLCPNTHGMLFTLLASALRALWGQLVYPEDRFEGMDTDFVPAITSPNPSEDPTDAADETREEIAQTVQQILSQKDDEDFELKRLIASYKLLREHGFTLRIIPGTPEENAPLQPLDNGMSYERAA